MSFALLCVLLYCGFVWWFYNLASKTKPPREPDAPLVTDGTFEKQAKAPNAAFVKDGSFEKQAKALTNLSGQSD